MELKALFVVAEWPWQTIAAFIGGITGPLGTGVAVWSFTIQRRHLIEARKPTIAAEWAEESPQDGWRRLKLTFRNPLPDPIEIRSVRISGRRTRLAYEVHQSRKMTLTPATEGNPGGGISIGSNVAPAKTSTPCSLKLSLKVPITGLVTIWVKAEEPTWWAKMASRVLLRCFCCRVWSSRTLRIRVTSSSIAANRRTITMMTTIDIDN